MVETITPATEISKAAIVARKYLDSSGEDSPLEETIPHLIEAIRLAYKELGIDTQAFWKSPLGKQLSTVKEAQQAWQGAYYAV